MSTTRKQRVDLMQGGYIFTILPSGHRNPSIFFFNQVNLLEFEWSLTTPAVFGSVVFILWMLWVAQYIVTVVKLCQRLHAFWRYFVPVYPVLSKLAG